MHREIIQWMTSVRDRHPEHFTDVKALDVGSQDINGNNRYLFQGGEYVGLDVFAGKNVDIVSTLHEYAAKSRAAIYDTIVSTDCLEHDAYWVETFRGMLHLLKSGGMLAWTCAGDGRDEHGTSGMNPAASPGTLDYYGNLNEAMISEQSFIAEDWFSEYEYNTCTNTMGPGLDLQFWGIRK